MKFVFVYGVRRYQFDCFFPDIQMIQHHLLKRLFLTIPQYYQEFVSGFSVLLFHWFICLILHEYKIILISIPL